PGPPPFLDCLTLLIRYDCSPKLSVYIVAIILVSPYFTTLITMPLVLCVTLLYKRFWLQGYIFFHLYLPVPGKFRWRFFYRRQHSRSILLVRLKLFPYIPASLQYP